MGKRKSRGLLNLIFSRRARGQGGVRACEALSAYVRLSCSWSRLQCAAAAAAAEPSQGPQSKKNGGNNNEVSSEGVTLLYSGTVSTTGLTL